MAGRLARTSASNFAFEMFPVATNSKRVGWPATSSDSTKSPSLEMMIALLAQSNFAQFHVRRAIA